MAEEFLFSIYTCFFYLQNEDSDIFITFKPGGVWGMKMKLCVKCHAVYIYAAQHKVMEGCFRTCSLIDRAGEAFDVEETQQYPVLSIGKG